MDRLPAHDADALADAADRRRRRAADRPAGDRGRPASIATGRLWVALTSPFTYVYDGSGDKIRTVQFKGADILTPNSLFFTKDGRVLVTPGCYEFQVP